MIQVFRSIPNGQKNMEGVLRHRQLRLWDEVCQRYPVPPAKAKKVREWILSGTLHDHAEHYSKNKKKMKSDSGSDLSINS